MQFARRIASARRDDAGRPAKGTMAAGARRFRSVRTRWKRVPLSCYSSRPTARVRRTPRRLIEDGRNAGAHNALDDDTSAYRMHVQREFLISSAASDFGPAGPGRAQAAASTAIGAVSHVPRAGSKSRAMKLSRTVGLAVDVSLVATTVAASLGSAELLRPARPQTELRMR